MLDVHKKTGLSLRVKGYKYNNNLIWIVKFNIWTEKVKIIISFVLKYMY
jgi:hypothetical protein